MVHCAPLPAHSDKFVDGIPFLGKFFLILCHDIAFVHLLIVVQVIGECLQGPCSLFDLLQGEVKTRCIVCLEFHAPALR